MTDIPHSPDAPAIQTSSDSVLLELVREMAAQRQALQEEQRAAVAERKREQRWKMLFQGLFFGGPFIMGLVYFLFFVNPDWFRFGPISEVVGVVQIDGEISANSAAGADKVIPALERAFSSDNVKAVVLSIDSPGGAPLEAERIYNAMADLKKKYPKPVTAVINNIGASAAYMIAMHTDQIVAGKYSIVGSIGAIMSPWELDRAIGKLEVTQRVYASGPLKSFLSPFTPISPAVNEKAQSLVNQIGQTFVAELQTTRGAKLKPGINYGTGEPWSATEALAIGLVDEIGTLDSVVANRWGIDTHNFGPYAKSGGFSLGSLLENEAGAVMEGLARHSFQVR